jgi:hypothetical protein
MEIVPLNTGYRDSWLPGRNNCSEQALWNCNERT